MKNGIVLTVHIQKGGAGKTTMTSFLGGELAARGYKVLLLDTDKQKNLTVNYRLKFNESDAETKEKNIYNFVTRAYDKDFDPYNYIIPTPFYEYDCAIDMIPAVSDQPSITKELESKNINRLGYLNKAIEQLKASYDFIIIDCGLDLDVLSYNCYQASDYVIVPVNPEPNTKECIAATYMFLEENMEANPKLKAGVAFLNVDSRESITHTTTASVRAGMEDICKIFDIQIRRDTKVKQAQEYRVPVNLFDPSTNASKDVKALIDELLIEMTDNFPEKMAHNDKLLEKAVKNQEVSTIG